MLKAILAGTSALVIAGSSLVYAQQRQGRPELGRGQPNIEDIRAFAEARLGALKAGLMLTPDQERNWPAFEQAARELAKQRLERMNAFASARRDRQPQSTDPTERLRRRAEVMSETGAALKKFADAMDPLYKSLDDSQKRRFAMLSRLAGREGGPEGRGFRGRDGERGFRGRDGEREFRGRDGGQGGFDRGSRRSENAPEGFEQDRRQGREDFERAPRRDREGFERDRRRENDRGGRGGEDSEQRL
jgi:hypothetical protein